ncbi:hypothetical protein E2C01_034806 [Portunus trituberculatus]|uniref:Uncharacterized protein n=1 Tax=Portunus trituberculatus TaxID=210409 RepID=A0A5B7F7X2_PORTR|nr:hypothetical protein [Portunus trituberculatus]
MGEGHVPVSGIDEVVRAAKKEETSVIRCIMGVLCHEAREAEEDSAEAASHQHFFRRSRRFPSFGLLFRELFPSQVNLPQSQVNLPSEMAGFPTVSSGCVSSILEAFVTKVSEVDAEFHRRILEVREELRGRISDLQDDFCRVNSAPEGVALLACSHLTK